MSSRLIMLLLASALALRGSVIDSGWIRTAPYFISDSTTVAFRFSSSSSSGVNFTLTGTSVLGGAFTDQCGLFDPFAPCPFGTLLTFRAWFPDASSSGATGSATINGTFTPSVVLGCPAPQCPHTDLRLLADPVLITAPGHYATPFRASGQLQAGVSPFIPLLLDESISGQGILSFNVVAATNSSNLLIRNTPTQPLLWTFVPEPSPWGPCLLLLSALTLLRRSGPQRAPQ